jgi:hypothetical protein
MGTHQEADPSLRRIERDSAVLCVIATLGALAFERGHLELAFGVIAGAGMMTIGYAAIRSGVDAAIGKAVPQEGEDDPAAPAARPRMSGATVRFVSRYAIVAAVAVVAIGPLHANPIGLVIGVSLPVIAIAVEAVRLVAGRRNDRGNLRPK